MQELPDNVWNDWYTISLLTDKLVTLAVACLGFYILRRIWMSQPPEKERRGVPRPVILFTGTWLAVLVIIVCVILLHPSTPYPQTFTVRAIYNASVAWALGGMTWIIVLGERHNRNVRKRILGTEELVAVFQEALQDTPPAGTPVVTSGKNQ